MQVKGELFRLSEFISYFKITFLKADYGYYLFILQTYFFNSFNCLRYKS